MAGTGEGFVVVVGEGTVVVVVEGTVVVVGETVVVVVGETVVVVVEGTVVVVEGEAVVVVVVDSSTAVAVPDGSKVSKRVRATAMLPETTPPDEAASAIPPQPALSPRSHRSAQRFAIGGRHYFTGRARQGPNGGSRVTHPGTVASVRQGHRHPSGSWRCCRYSAASLMASIIVGWARRVSTRLSVVTRALTARASIPISSEAR